MNRLVIGLLCTIMGVVLISCEMIPEAPQLYRPLDGAQVTHPTFIWESTGEEYELHLSQDPTFATIADTWSKINDTTFTPPDTLDTGTYYWRVRCRGTDWSEWSDVSSFVVSVGASELRLLSPPDADTIKTPTLFWSSTNANETYNLIIYQGQPEANQLILDTVITDTFFEITDSLDPVTYHWKIAAADTQTDYNRFVTYTLDESYFPAGPGYVWEYRCCYCYRPSEESGEPSVTDTTYYSIKVSEFIGYGDSIVVKMVQEDEYGEQEIYGFFRYKNDSVNGIPLFPKDGDTLDLYPDWLHQIVERISDSSVKWGYVDWFDTWNYKYEHCYRTAAVGLTRYSHGYGWKSQVAPHRDWLNSWKDDLIDFSKSE
ncbi:hypothetical protein GF359_05525 [candidate division WOR-3 bacterium]|uniref:Fibronectin type-III domain-containing protein n=1 Tax=candidate division WOR-3 bacterium TaxID=2052148 RepID=A0A9D5KBD4_UNCW3|nr:hypothetical protein [candidate division WOR-3 bacterium]MBD3364656.1 hypothetical protein [candidate division WOR-3 bacterium]